MHTFKYIATWITQATSNRISIKLKDLFWHFKSPIVKPILISVKSFEYFERVFTPFRIPINKVKMHLD